MLKVKPQPASTVSVSCRCVAYILFPVSLRHRAETETHETMVWLCVHTHLPSYSFARRPSLPIILLSFLAHTRHGCVRTHTVYAGTLPPIQQAICCALVLVCVRRENPSGGGSTRRPSSSSQNNSKFSWSHQVKHIGSQTLYGVFRFSRGVVRKKTALSNRVTYTIPMYFKKE